MANDKFSELVVDHLKGFVAGYKTEIGSYAPQARKDLTRRNWNKDSSEANIIQMAQKHGQAKTMKWVQKNQLRDTVGGQRGNT